MLSYVLPKVQWKERSDFLFFHIGNDSSAINTFLFSRLPAITTSPCTPFPRSVIFNYCYLKGVCTALKYFSSRFTSGITRRYKLLASQPATLSSLSTKYFSGYFFRQAGDRFRASHYPRERVAQKWN